MKKIPIAILFVLAALPATSHIGNPAVTFEGRAGKYLITALVTPPDVIPGTASVDIFVQGAAVQRVLTRPVYWYAGAKGTPEPDELKAVEGEPGHYAGIVWLMNRGTSSVQFEVIGEDGTEKVLVPVMAVSTAQKEMPDSLGYILLVLCLLLVVLMATIVGASVSDGIVRPSEKPSEKKILRRKLAGTVVAGLLLLVLLWAGNMWWQSWAASYQRFLYKPLKATVSLEHQADGHKLILQIDSTRLEDLRSTRNINLLIPDHGKLMHMFLVREKSFDVFAHLHPKRKDSLTFIQDLPPLPPGDYLVFADITRMSGFSETIPTRLTIPKDGMIALQTSNAAPPLFDRDDTWFTTTSILSAKADPASNVVVCGAPGIRVVLPDSSSIIWERNGNDKFYAGRLYSLKFAVTDESGNPAELEPYLGMMGHAVVMKDDGSSYIHLHPVGNYSMASQETMMRRFSAEDGPVKWDDINSRMHAFRDSVDVAVQKMDAMPEAERNALLMASMAHSETIAADSLHRQHSIVSFPYVFPSQGRYRIWIQMKRSGQILNSAFDTTVE